MADYWGERHDRILKKSAPYTVAGFDGGWGSCLYVQGEMICSTAASNALGLAQRRQFELKPDHQEWLAETDLGLWTYDGDISIPLLCLQLRQVSSDPRIAPHYAFSGEAKPTVPRGGPFGPPQLRVDVELPGEWGEGPPMVAVLDTGIDPATPSGGSANGIDLVRWDHGLDEDLLGTAPDLASEAGHGSFIVTLVHRLADGAVPMAAIRVLDPDGIGSEEELVAGLRRLRQGLPTPPKIVNLSLGGFTDDGGWLTTDPEVRELLFPISQRDLMPLGLGSELQAWTAPPLKDTVFVCAAGNDGKDRPFWPAAAARPDDPTAAPVIVSVASLDASNAPSSFTNRGEWVCVSTTGEEVLSAYSHGQMLDETGAVLSFPLHCAAVWSGTSFAAPVIAAELARRCRETGSTGAAAWQALFAHLTAGAGAGPGMGLLYDAHVERGVVVTG